MFLWSLCLSDIARILAIDRRNHQSFFDLNISEFGAYFSGFDNVILHCLFELREVERYEEIKKNIIVDLITFYIDTLLEFIMLKCSYFQCKM
jgi:hypothetical protein